MNRCFVVLQIAKDSKTHLIFQNDANGYGAIVEKFGNGPMNLDSTCWSGNRAHGNALVTSYSAELPAVSTNFGVGNDVEYRVENECEFVALVSDESPFPNLECSDFDADTCAFEISESTPPPADSTTQVPSGGTGTSTELPTEAPPPSAAPPTEALPPSSAFVVRLLPTIIAWGVAVIALLV